jgi:hypothetical protein
VPTLAEEGTFRRGRCRLCAARKRCWPQTRLFNRRGASTILTSASKT